MDRQDAGPTEQPGRHGPPKMNDYLSVGKPIIHHLCQCDDCLVQASTHGCKSEMMLGQLRDGTLRSAKADVHFVAFCRIQSTLSRSPQDTLRISLCGSGQGGDTCSGAEYMRRNQAASRNFAARFSGFFVDSRVQSPYRGSHHTDRFTR